MQPGSPLVKNRLQKDNRWPSWTGSARRGYPIPPRWTVDGVSRESRHCLPANYVVVKDEKPIVYCYDQEFLHKPRALGDGAQVHMQRMDEVVQTPVQYINPDKEIWEVPLQKRLIFSYVSPDGLFSLAYFSLSAWDDSPYMAIVGQGGIMSWCALPTKYPPAKFYEGSCPGYQASDYAIVPDGSKSFENTMIPDKFWQVHFALRAGYVEQVLPDCFDATAELERLIFE